MHLLRSRLVVGILEVLLFVAACLIAFAISLMNPYVIFADDSDAFRVRIAMELAQKQKEKERSRGATGQQTPTRCVVYTDLKQATEKAFVENKPLLMWVGMTCGESPDLCKSLPDAVHCLVPDNRGDDRPRVILVSPVDYANGTTWHKADIDATTPTAILKKYQAYKRYGEAKADLARSTPPVNYAPLYMPIVSPIAGGTCPGGVCPQQR